MLEVGVRGHLEDGWNLTCGTYKPRTLVSPSRGETFVQVLLFTPGNHADWPSHSSTVYKEIRFYKHLAWYLVKLYKSMKIY